MLSVKRLPAIRHGRSGPVGRRLSRPRVLAIASSGGHWIQLQAIAPKLRGELLYATTAVPANDAGRDVRLIPDSHKNEPLRLVASFASVLVLLVKTRPTAVVSTGAAPGCLAAVIMHTLGRRAVFIDSIANAEAISLSGRIAARAGVPTFTQWPHLADRKGVQYSGTVFEEMA